MTTSDQPFGAKPFSELDLPKSIQHDLGDAGYSKPTKVQAAVLAELRDGASAVVQSHTGSGKTAAFALNVHLRVKPDTEHVQALVLTPTRELCSQVAREVERLGTTSRHRVLAVYGGVNIERQIKTLKTGCEIVVATPGRLLDLYQRGAFNVSQVQTLVLDEADEMLSMGFWEDVTRIMGILPKQRQTLLFSATLPQEIERAAKAFMVDPKRIDLSSDVIQAKNVKHIVVHTDSKRTHLRNFLFLLEQHRPKNAIVFCNRKDETNTVARFLQRFGFKAAALNGDMSQRARERVLAKVRSGELDFMIATDVAARGIDISDLPHVFHFDLPQFNEVYVHRSGRTGRIGKSGVSVALVRAKFAPRVAQLQQKYGLDFNVEPLPSAEEVIHMQVERIVEQLSEAAKGVAIDQYHPCAANIMERDDSSDLMAFLLREFFSRIDHAEKEASDHYNRSKDREASSSSPQRKRKGRGRKERETSTATEESKAEDGKQTLKADSQNKLEAQSENSSDAPQPEAVKAKEASSEAPAQAGPKVKRIGPSNLFVTIGEEDGVRSIGDLMETLSALSGIDDLHFTGRGRVRSTSSHIEIDHDQSEAMIAAIHAKPRKEVSAFLGIEIEEGFASESTPATESPNDATQNQDKTKLDAKDSEAKPNADLAARDAAQDASEREAQAVDSSKENTTAENESREFLVCEIAKPRKRTRRRPYSANARGGNRKSNSRGGQRQNRRRR